MLIVTEIIDELRGYNVPEEIINKVTIRLIRAGVQSVYATMGEIAGRHTITPEELGQAIAIVMAQKYKSEKRNGT